MPTQISKSFNPGAAATSDNFTNAASLKSYINGLTCVASDLFVTIDCHADLSITGGTWTPATHSLTQRVLLRPAPGLGVNDLNRTTLNVGTTGIALNVPRDAVSVTANGIDIQGFRVLITGTGTPAGLVTDGLFAYNRVLDTSTGATGTSGVIKFIGTATATVSDNLCVVEGAAGKALFHDPGTTMNYRRNTIVGRGVALNAVQAYKADYAVSSTATNEVYIGCGATIMGTQIAATNCFSNTTPTAGRITGITVNTTAGALVVNESTDFRPTAAGPLINTATTAANNTKDILGNNRGTSPDPGAWELSPSVDAPTGNVTSIVVSGQTVTISGTTTSTPTSGQASLTASAVAYNSGVSQGPISVTLGSGTFTVQFTNVKVGRYDPVITLTNAGGTGSVTNGQGNAEVIGATGTVTSQTLSGQQLTISGTTSGSPTAVPVIIPAAATTPNGAITTSKDAALGVGTFTVTIDLPAGNYDPGVVRFTTAAGTSMPATGGTSAVSIVGISGNPEAPFDQPAPPEAPTNVTATPGNGLVTINMTHVGGTSFTVTASTGQTATATSLPMVIAMPNGVAVTFTATVTNANGTSPASAPSNSVTPAAPVTAPAATPPAAPTAVAAIGRNAKAVVSFTPPPAVAGYPVTLYTVMASSGQSATGTQSPITVAVPNGVAVTFTVTADNSVGRSAASLPSNSVTPVLLYARVKIVENGAVAVPVGTSVDFAWFDTVSPTTFAAPTAKGSFVTTADSIVAMPLTDTVLAAGAAGWATMRYIRAGVERSFTGEVIVEATAVSRVLFAQADASNGSGQEVPPILGVAAPLAPTRTYIFADPQTADGHGVFWDVRNPAKPKGLKDPDSTIDLSFDIRPWLLDAGDTYASHKIVVTGGLQLVSTFHANGVIGVFVKAGTVSPVLAKVTCSVKTNSNPPREDDRTVYLKITPR